MRDRVGHESIKTTMDTYGHLRPDILAYSAAMASGPMAGARAQLEA